MFMAVMGPESCRYELIEMKELPEISDNLTGALAAMLDLGIGSGPMNHAFDLNSKFRCTAGEEAK